MNRLSRSLNICWLLLFLVLASCKDAEPQPVQERLDRVDTSVLFSHLIRGSTPDDIEWQFGKWGGELYFSEFESKLLYDVEIVQSDIEPVLNPIGFAVTMTNSALSHWEIISDTNGPDDDGIIFVLPKRIVNPEARFVGQNVNLELRVANNVNYLNSKRLLEWSNSRVPDMSLIGANVSLAEEVDSRVSILVEIPQAQLDPFVDWITPQTGNVLVFSINGVPRSYVHVEDAFRHNRFILPLNVNYD